MPSQNSLHPTLPYICNAMHAVSSLSPEVIWYYKCRPVMRCSKTRLSVAAFNQTVIALASPTTITTSPSQSLVATTAGGGSGGGMTEYRDTVCVTAPFVQVITIKNLSIPLATHLHSIMVTPLPPPPPVVLQCWNTSLSGYTPLWNLHVHSKQTRLYQSTPCHCDSAV